MRLRLTILAALAVFVAFASLTPEDLLSSGSDAPDAVSPAAAEFPVDAVPADAETNVASSPDENSVHAALERLGPLVRNTSHRDALRYAFQAYYAYRSANPGNVRNPYFYYVDFGLDSRQPRGYVFDMERLSIVDGPFTVAHGSGSANGAVGVPTRFLNRRGSNATSLGLYLAQETYNFSGKAGGRRYRSIGLRLKGLSGSFNSNARSRGIVVHGAPYVTSQKAGRSQGCPAMGLDRAQRLIPMIANGGLVFHFSPRDTQWMRGDPWGTRAS
ncbi:MAG: hypothetical protein GEU90_11015 [Gemmatimonas sp.]|nr:hypothetical protein [Gemmatimonas sp.]